MGKMKYVEDLEKAVEVHKYSARYYTLSTSGVQFFCEDLIKAVAKDSGLPRQDIREMADDLKHAARDIVKYGK